MKMKQIAKGFGLCTVGFIGGVGVISYGVSKYMLTHDRMRASLMEKILTTLGITKTTQQTTGCRNHKEYHEVIFATEEDAKKAHEAMLNLVNKYGNITVADLLDLVGIIPCLYSDHKYGWDDLSGSYIKKQDDGYSIVIPSLAKEINK